MPAKSSGPSGIVRRPDHEQPGEAAGRTARARRAGRRPRTRPAVRRRGPRIGAAGAELVRPRRRRSGRHQDHLLGAGGRDLLEQPRRARRDDRRRGGSRRATAPSAGSRSRCGSVATGSVRLAASASMHVIAADAGEIERFAPALAPSPRPDGRRTAGPVRDRRAAQTRRRAATSMSCAITSSSRNPGWPRFSAAARGSAVPSSPRAGAAIGAAPRIRFHNSVCGEIEQRRRGQRRAEQAPRLPLARPPPRRRPQERERESAAPARAIATSRQNSDEPRDDRGQRRRREQGVEPARVGRAEVAAAPRRDHQLRTAGRPGRRARQPRKEPAESPEARRRPERPAGDPQGPAPAVEAPAPRPFHSPSGPTAGPAVDRGEHRAERADTAAGDEIDLDAGLVQRAEHAGVIGARRARRRSGPARSAAASNTGGPASQV